MERTFGQRVFYAFLRIASRAIGILFFRLRVVGRENYPRDGAALICANHQSFFDPVLVGLTCERRMNYLARESLFKVPVLKQLIQYLDAIPIDRDGMGLAGLKETLRRLKRGEMVLIFPEGTRTADGELQPLKPGFCSLARRGRAPLVPVGLDGAYQAWPRTQRLPGLAALYLVIGEPLSPQLVESLTDDALVAEVQRRLADCLAKARAGRTR